MHREYVVEEPDLLNENESALLRDFLSARREIRALEADKHILECAGGQFAGVRGHVRAPVLTKHATFKLP